MPEIETPTHIAIPAAWHQAAVQHKVRFIISGGNYATEGILPAAGTTTPRTSSSSRPFTGGSATYALRTFPTFGLREGGATTSS